MFPSRPVIAGKHFRLLLAVLLAAGVHGALVVVKFTPLQIALPAVSLPRSVSVFLGQKRTPKATVEETEQIRPAAEPVQEIVPVEPEPFVPVEKTVEPRPEKVKKIPEPQTEPLLPATVPSVEEAVAPVQQAEGIPEKAAPDIRVEGTVPERAEAKAAPAPPEDVGVNLAGTVQEAYPRYRVNEPPLYPRLARKRGQQGTVVLGVLVNREGRVDDLQVETSSGHRLLDRAALKAVRKWRFEPGRRGDVKVTMRVRVPVTFTLQ